MRKPPLVFLCARAQPNEAPQLPATTLHAPIPLSPTPHTHTHLHTVHMVVLCTCLGADEAPAGGLCYKCDAKARGAAAAGACSFGSGAGGCTVALHSGVSPQPRHDASSLARTMGRRWRQAASRTPAHARLLQDSKVQQHRALTQARTRGGIREDVDICQVVVQEPPRAVHLQATKSGQGSSGGAYGGAWLAAAAAAVATAQTRAQHSKNALLTLAASDNAPFYWCSVVTPSLSRPPLVCA